MCRFEFKKTEISGTLLITPFSAGDQRGEVIKDYSYEVFWKNAISFEVKESLYIFSHRNVVRGLHFQRVKEQSKLIRCVNGCIWSTVVDLRPDSKTFGKWITEDITQENKKELLVPGGCALGTLAVEDSLLSCKCGEKYYAEYADGISWNDPELGIPWPLESLKGEPVISAQDQKLQSFQSYLQQKVYK